jgi:hypothetical protein
MSYAATPTRERWERREKERRGMERIGFGSEWPQTQYRGFSAHGDAIAVESVPTNASPFATRARVRGGRKK